MKKAATLLLLAALLLTACADKSSPLHGTPAGSTPATAPAADPSTPDPGTDTPAPTLPASTIPAPTVPAPTQPSAAPVQPVSFAVREGDWETIQWENYSNVYFTLRIPKGWKVDWQGNAQQLEWSVRRPDGTVGIYNLDHNYAAKDASMQQILGMRFSLRYGTVQEYFETVYADSTEYFTVHNAIVPDNKAQLQAARPGTAIRDYQSLYATFKQNDLVGEGIYTAVIMDSPDVYIRGLNYGYWEINCSFNEWALQGELVNWLPVLSQIAQSFAYTDYYVQEWKNWLNPSGSSASPDGTISDSVLDSFEERDRADTILQEKRSDMLGEYERVYDNETGKIYRAYLGFLDDLDPGQSRYVPITDDQYADGYAGYIDRP